MMANSQGTIDQLVQLIEATLLPESVKKAQDELERLSTVPGYAHTLLQIMCSANYPNHIRNATAVALKNFVRANWSGDGEAPLSDDEREELRNALLQTMFQIPPFLRSLMTEIVCQVSRFDFPEKWPRLIQLLAENLRTSTDFDQLVVTLSTLEQLVNRYRHEMRSNRLWSEILLVVQSVAEPLTQLYSRMMQHLPDQPEGAAMSYPLRVSWLQIVLELTCIYHSLISQDLPEYFEDNLTPWMEGFLHMLQLKLPELEQKTAALVDTEPNEHDRLRTEICEIATLFSQRFEECFMPYTQRFMVAVWDLLVQTDSRIRFDVLVNAALNFLAAICQRPHYEGYFLEEGVLKAICENVIVKNMILRTEDLEIYENEPFEFLKRDIEGSDLETRRRGAAEFVRALCKQFEQKICALLSASIQGFLEQYQQSPAQNFVLKDVVYFLVSALATKGTTARHGATDTSQLIDVASFYQQNVRPDLLLGSPDELPILRCDAIKYVVLFRNQLSADQLVECFRGENGLLDRSIIRLLSSNNLLLHHYVSYAVERLLLLKVPNSQLPLLSADNFQLGTLIDGLFNCFKSPHAYETHYIMKALMRSFSLLNENMARSNAHLYVNKMAQMIGEAVRVPKNPLLVHFIFESICVLIRKAYSKTEGGLDKHIIPVIELVIQNDVVEFVPYVLQLIALLLDQSAAERQRGVLEVDQQAYVAFFPSLLRPDYWARAANVPALILVSESFIRCLPQLPFGAEYSDQMLAIFQRLINSKAYDQHGFRLANAFLSHLDLHEKMTSHAVLLAMLTRMHQNKTTKFARQFTIFIFRYAAVKGGAALVNTLEGIQSGIYGMLVERVLLAELLSMPQTTQYEEKRVIAIGAARLITETTAFLGKNYAPMVEAVVNILEAFEHKAQSPPTGAEGTAATTALALVAAEETEANEVEYSDPYCKLSNAQHPEPFAPEVTNIKKHFAQAVLIVAQSTNPESLECLNARVRSCLQAYSTNV